MADADHAHERLAAQLGLEIAQLALRAPARQPPRLQGGDTGGVVAPVLHAAQCVDHHIAGGTVPDVTDNSTHNAHGTAPDRRM